MGHTRNRRASLLPELVDGDALHIHRITLHNCYTTAEHCFQARVLRQDYSRDRRSIRLHDGPVRTGQLKLKPKTCRFELLYPHELFGINKYTSNRRPINGQDLGSKAFVERALSTLQ